MSTKLVSTSILAIGIAVGIGVVLLAWWFYPDFPRSAKLQSDSTYHAVLLTNGEAYYGRLQDLGSAHPVMTDVYYVRRRADQKEEKIQFLLIKRGREWHRPDRMILNGNHIVFVEPVHPESDVGQFIKSSMPKK